MIRTLQEKEILQNYLEELRESLFKQKGSYSKTLKNIPLPYSRIINDEFKKQKAFSGDTLKLTTIIESLETKLNNMQEINLTIAFAPSKQLFEKIYSWVKKNMGENVFINLNSDPKIMGGAIISSKGTYINNSLEKQLRMISIAEIIKKTL